MTYLVTVEVNATFHVIDPYDKEDAQKQVADLFDQLILSDESVDFVVASFNVIEEEDSVDEGEFE